MIGMRTPKELALLSRKIQLTLIHLLGGGIRLPSPFRCPRFAAICDDFSGSRQTWEAFDRHNCRKVGEGQYFQTTEEFFGYLYKEVAARRVRE